MNTRDFAGTLPHPEGVETARRRVEIVGAASGVGAGQPGCGDGPARLRLAGLDAHLAARGLPIAWGETLFPDQAPGEPAAQVVGRLCDRLARAASRVVRSGAVPLVLGGDHSCAMGTWRGVANGLGAPLGLLWIDAHLDAHTPQTSHTGRLHGMPLAALLGQGNDSLCQGDAVLSPEHVCVIGVRSFEPEEAALLAALGVRIYAAPEIERRGLDAVLREALARVQDGTAAHGITLDLDAIDPEDAPGVTTPVAGGLRAAELVPALADLARAAVPVAVEIVEYEPHHDVGGATARLIEELAAAMLGGDAARSMIELENRYSATNYAPLPVVLVRGEGTHLWDQSGRRYLDMMSAYSAVSVGHAHPRILRALTEQARKLAVTSRAYYSDRLPVFLERLCRLTGMDRALPVNTGLEAVETALKTARKWAHKVKGVPDGRAEIIACEGNFHGRSIAIVGMSSEPQYRDGFGPFPPGFRLVPYADARALEQAITPHTAAFLVEPIQGERGIIVPPPGYLAECARICREHNVLFIADEVQTGLGRTGRLLACEHDGVQPDGLVLGKALGGGVLPVSAFLGRDDVMSVFQPGDHGSTFGGNALAAAVGLEALNVIVEERLAERAATLGAHLLAGLAAIKSPLVRDVRGRGLLIGVEIDPQFATARQVVDRLLARGILSKDTHGTVVRFAPPLVIAREEIDHAVAETRRVLDELERELKRAA
jgi:ornithine--oxo-acid transaminase